MAEETMVSMPVDILERQTVKAYSRAIWELLKENDQDVVRLAETIGLLAAVFATEVSVQDTTSQNKAVTEARQTRSW